MAQPRVVFIGVLVLVVGLTIAPAGGPITTANAQTAETEPNDDFETADALGEANVSAQIDQGESDFYRIEADTTDALDLAVTSPNLADITLRLYGPDRQQLLGDGNDFEGIDITRKLPETGTYYIEVTADGQVTTDYELQIDRVTPSENDQFAPNDDFDSAAPLQEGFNDARLVGGESDFYRIDGNTTDALSLTVQDANLADIALRLYGPDRQQLLADGNDFEGIDITRKLPETGTYFVEVAGQGQQTTTAYTLSVDRVTPSENDQFAPNDEFESAAPLEEGFNDARLVGGESDFYRIDGNTTDALSLAVQDANLGDIALRLYGPDRQQLLADGNDFEGIDLTRRLPETGTYFVEVASQSQQTTTAYTLSVDRVTPSENDQFAPNDGFNSAAAITQEFSDARLVGGESDFYAVSLEAGEGLAAEVQNTNLGDIALRVYGPDRSQLAGDGNDFEGIDVSIEASTSGTYYVEVAGQSRQTTTAYTLRSNQTGLNPSAIDPALAVTSQPTDIVSADATFEVTYQITNTGDAAGAFTVTVPDTSGNVSVDGFSGDIQGPNPDGSPPSTSTTSVDPGERVSVTVTYRTAQDATGTGTMTVEATPALSNATDSATTTVEIGEPTVPSTPRGRALQVADVSDPVDITQNDITIAITRRDRGEQANGLNVTQNDITTLITLRDRAN